MKRITPSDENKHAVKYGLSLRSAVGSKPYGYLHCGEMSTKGTPTRHCRHCRASYSKRLIGFPAY